MPQKVGSRLSMRRVGKIEESEVTDAATNVPKSRRSLKDLVVLDSVGLKHRVCKQYWSLTGQKVKLTWFIK